MTDPLACLTPNIVDRGVEFVAMLQHANVLPSAEVGEVGQGFGLLAVVVYDDDLDVRDSRFSP